MSPGNGVNQRKGRMNASFCIILGGLRPAEIRKHSIADIFGNMAAKALHNLMAGLLIPIYDARKLLGIELLGQRRRSNDVAKNDRQISTLKLGTREYRWFLNRPRLKAPCRIFYAGPLYVAVFRIGS